jgi:lipopolysaccharide biosynthesis glycosyltransferase
MKVVVCTAVIGDNANKLAEITVPTIEGWAKRCGYDFKCFDKYLYNGVTGHFSKFYMYKLFESYDYCIWVDSDIIISPMAGEIELNDTLMIYEEGKYFNSRFTTMSVFAKRAFGVKREYDKYYNSGVMIIPKKYSNVFKTPSIQLIKTIMELRKDGGFYDQNLINYLINWYGVKVTELDDTYNCMKGVMLKNSEWKDRLDKLFIHYAGMDKEARIEIARSDFEKLTLQ